MHTQETMQYRGLGLHAGKKMNTEKQSYLCMCARTLPVTVWTTAHLQMLSSTMKSYWNSGPKIHACCIMASFRN